MRAIAKIVHASFRRVERAADWLTGCAGPVFVAICIILVAGGVWTFFTTMFLELAPIPTELANLFHTYSPAHIALGLVPTLLDSTTKDPIATLRFFFWLAFCLYIVYSIGWHYYMACTIPPGSVCDGLGDAFPERRSGPGSNVWWARSRARAATASGPKENGLKSDSPHVIAHGQPEAAAPVRVSSVADLKKLNKALDGLDSNRARSASVTVGSRSSSGVSVPFVPSHRSSNSSEAGTPRVWPKSDLPLSIHDLNPSLVSTPAPLDNEPSANPLFVRAAAHQSQDGHTRDTALLEPHAEGHDEMDHVDDEDEDLFPLAGMCHKCAKIPLVKALTVLPPELRKIEKQIRTNKPSQTFDLKLSVDDVDEGEAEVQRWLGDEATVKLVAPPKPERSHHCRACKTCALKFDHHCPWLNQCVGLGNERYFVLFMAWLSFGCSIVVWSGVGVMKQSLSWNGKWDYPYTPRVLVMLLFILALVMGAALAVMAGWQLILVSRGETSVESQDNTHYRELAEKRGQQFVNVYDVGRWRNLELFFNVGEGSPYRWYTVLLPMRVPPYSDGWHFAKKRGLGGKHAGIELQEQLTDEEFEEEHYENGAAAKHVKIPAS